jgi:hypothetical protein
MVTKRKEETQQAPPPEKAAPELENLVTFTAFQWALRTVRNMIT